jgi:hypothetical protein
MINLPVVAQIVPPSAPMAPVAPMKTEIVAPKSDYPTWEISAVQPVPASSGPSHLLDSIAETSPDKLFRNGLD